MYDDSHYAREKWLSWEEMAIILTLEMMNFSEKTYLVVSAVAFDALFPDLTPLSSYKPPPDKWHKAKFSINKNFTPYVLSEVLKKN